MTDTTYCGFIAIVGRPNVGKSTLLNQLIGQKVSITARKPQTTRHRILGIHTENNIQSIYVDTPGLHKVQPRAINKLMNKAALHSLRDVDVIIFVLDSTHWTLEDDWVLEKIRLLEVPVILVVNKVDKIQDKALLLPEIEKYAEKFPFHLIMPLSAETGENVPELNAAVAKLLPESPFLFPEDQVTSSSDRFLVAEIIREKIIRLVGQEVPYALTVQIEEYKMKKSTLHIHAIIWVEREGQKAIIIGKNGMLLKQIGQQARIELEKMIETKVYLALWVKVKSGWSDDERALKSLGYYDAN